MKKMNKKGFTIVELVIVIAVIAILAAVMIPTFSGIIGKAKASALLQEVKAAYTDTLADDLADDDSSNDNVYNKTIVYIEDGYTVKIDINGKATVAPTVTTGENADEATHTLVNGKLDLK